MVKLEYFTKDDFDLLIKWINNERVLQNWTGSLFSFPLTHDKLEWYIQGANDRKTSDVFIYKVVDTESRKTVGHISLGSISQKNRSARISRVLVGDTCQRGKGYCSGMIQEVLRIGFEELDLHRIALGVYATNYSAIRCYQRCGFVKEGISRDVLKYGNEYWSLLEMSILEDEWRQLYQRRAA
ncbi:MAG TPA: GNAT family protein [Flavisolibacter sp.]|nr:GNAT family protein [Flavisolibacter sp.]